MMARNWIGNENGDGYFNKYIWRSIRSGLSNISVLLIVINIKYNNFNIKLELVALRIRRH